MTYGCMIIGEHDAERHRHVSGPCDPITTHHIRN